MQQFDQMAAEDANQIRANKFRLQTLEEVIEITEESDLTSDMGSNSPERKYSFNDDSFDNDTAFNTETDLRVRLMDDLEYCHKEIVPKLFKTAPVQFECDFEDF